MGTFNAKKLRDLLASLDPETLEAIKAKARWEKITIAAVLRGYYPALWDQIKV
jgi:hypothetical protein